MASADQRIPRPSADVHAHAFADARGEGAAAGGGGGADADGAPREAEGGCGATDGKEEGGGNDGEGGDSFEAAGGGRGAEVNVAGLPPGDGEPRKESSTERIKTAARGAAAPLNQRRKGDTAATSTAPRTDMGRNDSARSRR